MGLSGRYLRGDQWFWMTGESMNYSGLQTASTWQASSPCGGMETRSPHLWTDYPCDDHVYFICLKGQDPSHCGVTVVLLYW